MFNQKASSRARARLPLISLLTFAMVVQIAPPPPPQTDPSGRSFFGQVASAIGAGWNAMLGLLRPDLSLASERVELVEERTATAKFFQEPDGSRVAEIHALPIHVKGPDGKYRDIETDLKPSARSGFGWRTGRGHFATEFAPEGRKSAMVSLRTGSGELTFGPLGTEKAKPRIKGNVITYSGVYPGVDLRYTMSLSGLKEEIVLHRDPGVSEFRFGLGGTIHARVSDDGGLIYLGPEGEETFTSPPPFMVETAEHEGDLPASSNDVSYSVSGEPGSQTLTVRFERVPSQEIWTLSALNRLDVGSSR